MKTNIKMRVTPEQSRRVQEICFENGVEWLVSCKLISYLPKPYLIIENYIITYRDYGRELEHNINIEEIDADLFIRTNGTCKETFKEQQSYNDSDLIIKDDNIHMIGKAINKHYDTAILEQKLKKKNEILKKARIKRKNQREELHKLLQKNKELLNDNNIVEAQRNHYMLKSSEHELKINELSNKLLEATIIISYLESKVK